MNTVNLTEAKRLLESNVDARDFAEQGPMALRSALEALDQIAAALELPEAGDIVWYARHTKELCRARGEKLAELYDHGAEVGDATDVCILKAGTFFRVHEVPLRLVHSAYARTHPDNFRRIADVLEEKPTREPSVENPCTCASTWDSRSGTLAVHHINPECPYHGARTIVAGEPGKRVAVEGGGVNYIQHKTVDDGR